MIGRNHASALAIALILILSAGDTGAQQPAPRAKGLGVGVHHYSTVWWISGADCSLGPCVQYHEFSRVELAGWLERPHARQLFKRPATLRMEARLGFVGGTKDDSFDTPATSISDGGFSVALGVTMLAPLSTKPPATETSPRPYGGVGVDFFSLGSNGKVDGGEGEPWRENVFTVPLVLGVTLPQRTMRASIELRWAPIGFSFTDFDDGDAEQEEMPSGWTLQFRLGVP